MPTVKSARGVAIMTAALVVVSAAVDRATAADMTSGGDGIHTARHRHASVSVRARHARHEVVVANPVIAVPRLPGVGQNDPEYYERPLYQGPPFLYRPYYGSGPSLQWFDFGLGRDSNGFE